MALSLLSAWRCLCGVRVCWVPSTTLHRSYAPCAFSTPSCNTQVPTRVFHAEGESWTRPRARFSEPQDVQHRFRAPVGLSTDYLLRGCGYRILLLYLLFSTPTIHGSKSRESCSIWWEKLRSSRRGDHLAAEANASTSLDA